MLTAAALKAFSKVYLQADFDNPVETPAFHEEMWEVCCSNHRRVAIAAPRNHAKTSAITGTYLLGSVLFRDHDFVIIISDTEEQAKLFLADAKLQFLENEPLMAAFMIDPDTPLEKDSTTDIIVNFLDGHQARIMAKGSGQKGRGVKWKNKRPNLIIGDDMENDELVESPLRRRNFRKWLRKAITQSLSKYGKIRIVGTILHSDSALEHYMPENQTPPELRQEHIIDEPLKTYSTYTGIKRAWYGIRYRGHPAINDYSSLLWPENYDPEWYMEKYAEFEADGDSEGYAQEYLNQPLDETKAFFKKEDMLPMVDEDWAKKKTWYCGVDFAISKNDYNDYTVFASMGLDDEGVFHVDQIHRGRYDTLEIVDKFFVVEKAHKGIIFMVEKGSIWEAVSSVLYKEMGKRQIFFDVIPIGSIKDKKVKATPLRYRFQAKAIRIDKTAIWWTELELELRAFDRGKHDDQVDALALPPLQIYKLAEGEDYGEKAESEEYDDQEYDDRGYTDLLDDEGVSPVTGYGYA